MSIESAADLDGMRRVGRVVAITLAEMTAAVRIGLTTTELDAVAASTFKRFALVPLRNSSTAFPASPASASTMKSSTASLALGGPTLEMS